MESSIPSRIGRYTVDRLLGSGAMGFVYLGRDPELDRAVAIKTVRHLDLDPPALQTFLERFRNEARAAARLHHPNIVQVYDVGEDPDVGPYLVFEYVAGSTLKQHLRSKGALSPEGVVRLAEEIGDALDAAHGTGIIHRDLKPDNLLVTPDGKTKLADFGVARVPDAALTKEGQFLGTPCYAAPETLKLGTYGVHSDLFSFAAVLYEAASGKRAFPGNDAVAVAHKVIHDEPAPPRSVAERPKAVPARIEALLLQGLDKNPDARFESAGEYAEALREAYVDAGLVSPEVGRPASRRVPLPKAPEDSPRSLGAFFAVLFGALAVGVAFVVAFDDPEDPTPIVEPPAAEADAGLDAAIEIADAGIDAGPEEPSATEVDAGLRDAATDAAEDAGTDAAIDAEAAEATPPLTPHEREEAAKDALDRCRAAIADGDFEGAREALAEARRFDPENPDIEALAGTLPPGEPVAP